MRRIITGLTRLTERVAKPAVPLLCISLLILIVVAGVLSLPDKAQASGTINACDGCHGNGPLDNPTRDGATGRFPGSHNTHAGAWYTTTDSRYSMNCELCHTSPGYGTAYNHQGDSIQVNLRWFSMASNVVQSGSVSGWGSYSRWTSFVNWSTMPSTSFGSCNNTYCHSNGTGGTVQGAIADSRPIEVNSSPRWGTNAQQCFPCHGHEANNPGSGAPWYTSNPSSTVGGTKANSHMLHAWQSVGMGVVCYRCHSGTTTTGNTITSVGNHIKRSYSVSPGSGAWGSVSYTYAYTTIGGTCTNASCHTSNLSSGLVKRWGSNDPQATCVKCHGLAGQTPAQFTADNSVAGPGYWQTGRNTWNTTGTFTNGVSNAAKVWAHDSHLRSPSVKGYTTLRGVECDDCHSFTAIKTDIYAAGHMNGSTQFAWSTLVRNSALSNPKWGTLALAPWYSSGNQACGNIYCHGMSLQDNGAGGWVTLMAGTGWGSLRFNNNQWLTLASAKDDASCNQCHQSPPGRATNYDHTAYTISSDCAGCHGHNGNGGSHIDGILYGAGSCNSCHWYDTADAGAWRTNTKGNSSGKLWNSVNAWGAHIKHINHLKARTGVWLTAGADSYANTNFNSVCGFCHSRNSTDHQNSSRQVIWNTTTHQFGAAAMSWDTVTRSCSNLDCHYITTPTWHSF